ncbi:hypothetical protein FRX31_018552 [Thalictrum thalictroides]|uniref:Uncharacterized protein n=1 Tax=Thalictrum thalictroides TaxID=46969 RepID=A0A7J6W3T7_THATH|nr:hypothetical protein FRX31_018552 [Thalictrum thalictroides]
MGIYIKEFPVLFLRARVLVVTEEMEEEEEEEAPFISVKRKISTCNTYLCFVSDCYNDLSSRTCIFQTSSS